jgi:hypothetical protein
MKGAVAATGLLALVSAPLTTARADATKPEVAYWHVWTDAQRRTLAARRRRAKSATMLPDSRARRLTRADGGVRP